VTQTLSITHWQRIASSSTRCADMTIVYSPER
jgi:hypothetical protein